MLKGNYRIKPHFDEDWTGLGSKTKTGHILRARVNERINNLPKEERDEINEPIWNKAYTVDESHEGTDVYKGLRCYTDGSKTKTGAGAGICIAAGSHIMRTRAHGLSKHATEMQAELHAIRLACGHLATIIEEQPELKTDFKKLVILTDSRPALAALNQIDTRSKTVKDTKDALNLLAETLPVEIKWIRAHKGIVGNEIADRAAKSGAKLKTISPTTQAKAAIKQHVNDVVYESWNERWREQSTCRQTKIFLPEIDRGKSKKIMSLNKAQLSILVRNLTGHAHLDAHRKVMGDYGQYEGITHAYLDHIDGAESNVVTRPVPKLSSILNEVDINLAKNYGTCKLCCIQGMQETPIHLLLECPYTWRGRADLFKEYDPTHTTFSEFS